LAGAAAWVAGLAEGGAEFGGEPAKTGAVPGVVRTAPRATFAEALTPAGGGRSPAWVPESAALGAPARTSPPAGRACSAAEASGSNTSITTRRPFRQSRTAAPLAITISARPMPPVMDRTLRGTPDGGLITASPSSTTVTRAPFLITR
jgi:hypothetical protein